MAGGNHQVILCERGIRTFEPATRFSLDVCAAAVLKELSHLPLVLDPSHAVGIASQVPLVAQAAAALEVDGLLVEVHPNPAQARCDREQALSFGQFDALFPRLRAICGAVDRTLI
jgi:3-deoxy-7-phosphoheptulonate synthase